MTKKPVKIWIFLLIAPLVLLIVSSLAQFGVRYVLSQTASTCLDGNESQQSSQINSNYNDNSKPISGVTDCITKPNKNSAVKIVINIFSLLVGVVAVLGIMGTPIWIIFLVKATQYNNKLSAGTPQVQPPPSVTQ